MQILLVLIMVSYIPVCWPQRATRHECFRATLNYKP